MPELPLQSVRDAAGAITHFVSYVEDISGRKTTASYRAKRDGKGRIRHSSRR
ncbi:MAG TPA: hypothetical protein VMN58_00650 [Acidimicrobiales bacterium]|nr:hypothetical protein [Acidimicrobiales bacterium]